MTTLGNLLGSGFLSDDGVARKTSVHLTDWPDAGDIPADENLVDVMDKVREICSSCLRLRENVKIPVRVPLGVLQISGPEASALTEYSDILSDEINVKDIRFSENIPDSFSPVLRPDGSKLGPRLKSQMQQVMTEAKAGRWEINQQGHVEIAEVVLAPDEFKIVLEPDSTDMGNMVSTVLKDGETVVELDTTITPEFEREGQVRHLVRAIQQKRREQGLNVSDRIHLSLKLPKRLETSVRELESYVAEQILATSINYDSNHGAARLDGSVEFDGSIIYYKISKV